MSKEFSHGARTVVVELDGNLAGMVWLIKCIRRQFGRKDTPRFKTAPVHENICCSLT